MYYQFPINCYQDSYMLFLLPHTVSIAVCPPILGACRLSPAYLRAVYAPVEGVWKVQLAWSNEHPTCLIILEEEAPGEFTFKVIDNQTC